MNKQKKNKISVSVFGGRPLFSAHTHISNKISTSDCRVYELISSLHQFETVKYIILEIELN